MKTPEVGDIFITQGNLGTIFVTEIVGIEDDIVRYEEFNSVMLIRESKRTGIYGFVCDNSYMYYAGRALHSGPMVR